MRVISNYVSPPKKVGVAGELVVTRVMTQVVTRVVEAAAVTAPAAPSIPSTRILRAPIEGDNTDVFSRLRQVFGGRRRLTLVKCVDVTIPLPHSGEGLEAFAFAGVEGDEIYVLRSVGRVCRTAEGLNLFFRGAAKSGWGPLIRRRLSEVGIPLGELSEEILSTLIPLFNNIAKVIGAPKIKVEDDRLASDVVDEWLDEVVVYEQLPADPKLAHVALRRWGEFVGEVFKGVDERVRDIYLPFLAPPYASVYVAPCAILGTPSRAGKTTLARALGVKFERVTEASLTGDDKTRGNVIPPILNEETRLVQIENLKNVGVLVSGLLKLTSIGGVSSWSPIIIAFNVYSESLADLDAVVKSIKVNPHALGSRFMPIILRRVSPIHLKHIDDVELINATVESVHYVAKKYVRRIYDSREVRDFLLSEQGVELPPVEVSFTRLQEYLNSVRHHANLLVNKYAVLRALAERLDDVVFGQATLQEIVEEALNHYETYYHLLRAGLENFGELTEEGIKEKLKAVFEGREKGTALIKIVLLALKRIVRSRVSSLENWVERKAELRIDEFASALKEEAKRENVYRTCSTNRLMTRVEAKVKSDEILNLISLEIDRENGKVSFDPIELMNILSIVEEDR